jgi:putative nucleotidyltransferase with HDIG domain
MSGSVAVPQLEGVVGSVLRGSEAEAGLPGGSAGSALSVAVGLEAALRARAPGLYSSTPVVRRLASATSARLELSGTQQSLADLCGRVRDIGMIGLPDVVVLARGPLTGEDWRLVNTHPELGAELLESVGISADAIEVVRHHHERWDGQGYPAGLRGEEIPLLSRVLAAADAFVAIAQDRPHRRGIGAEGAIEHLREQSAAQFDPAVVEALVAAVVGDPVPRAAARRRSAVAPAGVAQRPGDAPGGERELAAAIAAVEWLPAFELAHERVLGVVREAPGSGGDLVAAIEADTAITLAVLRAAQGVAGSRPVSSIPDAVAALGPTGVRGVVAGLPCAAFPWRTPQEALLHELRMHALSVSRAAERIARESGLRDRDTLIAAALLHDVGKLALARTGVDYAVAGHARTGSPEKRLRAERAARGVDHASVGALVLGRARVPRELREAVAEHHQAAPGSELAMLVRLADMVAHHSHGNPVDRKAMLELASACGVPHRTLHEVLFDLPHAGGSQRRRAEPSPLTPRETEILRLLAQGKVYGAIALELGLSVSTVRSHLHTSYHKLGVVDRAQAVLRATEMAWI